MVTVGGYEEDNNAEEDEDNDKFSKLKKLKKV